VRRENREESEKRESGIAKMKENGSYTLFIPPLN